MGAHVAPRPDPDPPDWYDDHAWETGDDAHAMTFEPIPRRCPAAYPLHDHHPAEEAPHVRDHADP